VGLVVLAASLILTLWFATRKVVSGWNKRRMVRGIAVLGTALGFSSGPEVNGRIVIADRFARSIRSFIAR